MADSRTDNCLQDRWQAILSGRRQDTAIYDAKGGVSKSFADVEDDASRWADLLATHPVVGLQARNDAEWPGILLGAWRAGAAVVLMDADLVGERRSRLESVCGVSVRVEDEGGIVPLPAAAPVSWRGEVPCLLKLTSGTSGDVRAIRFSASQLLADCDAVCETMGIRENDRNYGAISFSHSYGFSNLVTPLLSRGVPLVVAGDMIPRALWQGLGASQATVFPAVPALFRALCGLKPGSMALRLCISAGAPLSGKVADQFRTGWGLKLHSFYGASECGGICYDASDDPVPEGFVGLPLNGVTVEFEDGADSGAIVVRSAAVGHGYHPLDETQQLENGSYRPPDLLEAIDGEFRIKGRISRIINVAGRKLSPGEIEAVIRDCPGVREVAVLGLSASARGEDVAACVAGAVSEKELKTWCAMRLPAWKVPRHWRIMDTLPLNARGKTSRSDLQALFAETQA